MKNKNMLLLSAAALATALTFYTIADNQYPAASADVKKSSETRATPPVFFKTVYTGGMVTVFLPTKTITGTINTVQISTQGVTQIGGDLSDDQGVFVYGIAPDKSVTGLVILSNGDVFDLDDRGVYIKRKITDVRCGEMPGEFAAAPGDSNSIANSGTSAVTSLASRPGAKVHVYLDFDGETIQDPSWNGGKIIQAAPAGYMDDKIKEVWSLVAERFAAFNINVTTRRSDYDSASPTNRVRVIVTPTNNWCRGLGGVSFIGSMGRAGSKYTSSTIPTFVFSNMFSAKIMKSVSECIAHEVGHALGLTHDGAKGAPYYYGQGDWAPVMGVAYKANIVQWSKGEYATANNKQDDIACIASAAGFASSGSLTTGTLQGTFIDTFVLTNEKDYKTYNINLLKGGTINFQASPGLYGGVDVKIDVISANGAITSFNAQKSQSAGVYQNFAPGAYKIRVSSTGDGDAQSTGYTAYGSIGTVIVSGSINSN